MASIQRIGALSAFKVGFCIYGILGLVMGILCSAVAFAGVHLSPHPSFGGALALVPLVLCPIVWGLVGGGGAALTAFLYNLGAGWIGGLEVELR